MQSIMFFRSLSWEVVTVHVCLCVCAIVAHDFSALHHSVDTHPVYLFKGRSFFNGCNFHIHSTQCVLKNKQTLQLIFCFFCHVEKEECIAFMDIAVQPGMQNVENKYKQDAEHSYRPKKSYSLFSSSICVCVLWPSLPS